MLKLILLSSLVFSLSCSKESGLASQVEVSIIPDPVLVLNAPRTLYVETFVDGQPTIEEVELASPNMVFKIGFTNSSSEAITLVAAEFKITGGGTFTTTYMDPGQFIYYDPSTASASGIPTFKLAARPFIAEVLAGGNTLTHTDTSGVLLNGSNSLNSTLDLYYYFTGFADLPIGVSSTFNVQAKFIGWVGDLNTQKANFTKNVFFSSNGL